MELNLSRHLPLVLFENVIKSNAWGVWRLLYHKTKKEAFLFSLLWENSGETLNYVSCFPYDFFRALAAS